VENVLALLVVRLVKTVNTVSIVPKMVELVVFAVSHLLFKGVSSVLEIVDTPFSSKPIAPPFIFCYKLHGFY